jgi:hypothetical protein
MGFLSGFCGIVETFADFLRQAFLFHATWQRYKQRSQEQGGTDGLDWFHERNLLVLVKPGSGSHRLGHIACRIEGLD